MGDKIGNVARKERRDTAANWTSNNPIPLDGEWCLETDTGNVKIGDGILAWTVLSYVNQIVETFDISAANKTMTLPKVTGYPQEYSFFWTGGDGTFKATTAVTNSETVGGAAAATWTGEGEGSMTCVSNGTNWEVKKYSDFGDLAARHWQKRIDGTLKQWGISVVTFSNVSAATAGITVKAMNDWTKAVVHANMQDTIGVAILNYRAVGASATSLNTTFVTNDSSLQTGTEDFGWSCIERWRT